MDTCDVACRKQTGRHADAKGRLHLPAPALDRRIVNLGYLDQTN